MSVSTESIFKKHTQFTVKNRKNDGSDASLQVDPLGDFRGTRSGARHPILSPLKDGERKWGVVLPLQCL